MKMLKRTMAITLSLMTIAGACGLAACKNGDTSGTLVIEAAQLGYGLNWLDTMASEWSAKTGNEVKIVKKVGAKGNDAIGNEIDSLASDKDIFIYRTAEYATNVYEGQIQHQGQKYECVYLDLTDTYKKELEGENGATIESKIYDNYKKALKIGDKYYGLPWIDGTLGLMRNITLWENLGLTDADIPLTTDEMFETCEKIKIAAASKKEYQNVAPFIYSSEDEYYTSFIPVWFAQYEGTERIENFKAGVGTDGLVSKNIFTYTGQQKMLEVTERLLSSANGYQHNKSTSLNFTDMQGQFLKNQAVFCVNGAWIEIEMGSGYSDAKIDYIKTPVISALAEKLSFYNADAEDGANDDKLSQLVAYVDATDSGYTGKPDFASETDVDIVREARGYGYITLGLSHVMVGNAYSKKTDMIKSFMEYMYSDSGMDAYYRATEGACLPANMSANGAYSNINISDFKKSVNEIDRNEIFVYTTSAKMFSIGGVNTKLNNGVTDYIAAFANGTLTASQVILKNQQYMESNWSTISSKIR